MDSVSQIVLGSTVSLLVTRGKHPKRAIIYGAALGTLPDLDVLVPMGNDLDATIKHRTWSHSWITMTLVAPFIAYIIHWKDKHFSLRQWGWLVWLTLITHSALDAFTVYGTGVFWPLLDRGVMGGSIFIIDPIYTLPLLLTTIIAWRGGQSENQRFKQSMTALSLSSLYLIWGLYSQHHIESLAARSLTTKELAHTDILVTPTPFNSILWRVLAVDKSKYIEGYYSWLDDTSNIDFKVYERNEAMTSAFSQQPGWQKLDYFAHGFTSLSRVNDEIIATDLRMGAEPVYIFRFRLGKWQDQTLKIETPTLASVDIEDLGFLNRLWRRLLGDTTIKQIGS